jgi:hypothetical protein
MPGQLSRKRRGCGDAHHREARPRPTLQSRRLLISLRTVKYHLHKVFIKLGIGSQNELERVPQRPE